MKEYKKIKKLNIYLRKGMFFLALILLCAGTAALNTDAAAKNAWVKKSGKTYYYNNKGKKVKGLKKIKGSYYYFSSKGVLYKKGWKTVKGGKYYFAKTNGKAYKGIKTISGKKYLFSTKCKLYGTDINAYGGKMYYTVKGMVQTGWQTVSGKTYYFNAKGIMQTGKWIDKVYYVDTDGVMQKNCWIRLSAGNYYVDASGKKLMGGWVTMGDYKYYFTASGRNTKTVRITGDDNKEPESQEPETKESESDTKESETQESETDEDEIKNTLVNRLLYRNLIRGFINGSESIIANSCGAIEFDESEYNQTLAMIEDARKYVDNYNDYTAMELYNYYNYIEANAPALKLKQVLIYYPDQSKAIFDAINEYRKGLGIAELVWSDALSKTSRLEAGYHVYLYANSLSTDAPLSEGFFENHHGSQNGYTCIGGNVFVTQVVSAWKASSWHDPLLRYEAVTSSITYGAVAHYTYRSENGLFHTKIIFTAWPKDEEAYTHATPEYYDVILNCATSDWVR